MGQVLSPDRLTHTLGVRDTAVRLHSTWKIEAPDREDIERMALLHDFAKEMGPLELHEATLQGWLTVGTELLDTPGLEHAPLSAAYARHRFGIQNHEILSAIAYHPTGHPDFELTGLILFLADYLEPHRPFENHRERILDMAEGNPWRAALEVFEEKIHYVELQGKLVHPVSLAFGQRLRKRCDTYS